MGRNYYHEYKLLEGLLDWYFGPRASLSYHCRPDDTGSPLPVVLVNGEVVDRGRLSAARVVKYIEDMGIKRPDDV